MKRKLLLLVLFLGTSYYSNAQVIDIVGKGIHDESSANLTFTDINNIDHIDVAVLKSWGPPIPAENVEFSNYLGSATTTLSLVTIHKSTPKYRPPGELLTASFTDIDASGIDMAIDNDGLSFSDFMQSFYAFVYRDIPDSSIKSFASLETVYFYKNGNEPGGPYVYNIPIDPAWDSRDITVKIPISELEADGRRAIIDITAGELAHPTVVVTTYIAAPMSDLGNSLFIGEYTLTDVPGDVTNISVSIYSPKSNADSFYVNGVVVDVEIVPEGCTLTQGYWKTHSYCKTNGNGNGPERDDTWDLIGPDHNDKIGEFSIFMDYDNVKDEQTYCEVFDTNPGKGGKYYILAHQYIAAELNILAGANPTDVLSAFEEATEFLNDHTPEEVKKKENKDLQDDCVRLGGILADFNEGAIGPGHCDDDETASKILDVDEPESLDNKVKIYPNPATSIGRINFTPKENAETTVEVYNVLGQKISVLYNEYTMGGVPVTVDYDAQRFKQGIHFVHIKNGSSSVTKKLSISK